MAYLDHAATTPVDPEVADAMARVLRDTHGNPSSIYAEGRAARALVDNAREEVAASLGAEPTVRSGKKKTQKVLDISSFHNHVGNTGSTLGY